MIIRIVGGILIVLGCGSVGFLVAAAHKNEEKTARQLLLALNFLSCELRSRLTPLPELCRKTAEASNGIVRTVFYQFANEMEKQIRPNAEKCMMFVLESNPGIPSVARKGFVLLSRSLGKFDIEEQLSSVEQICAELKGYLQSYTSNQEVKLRSYQTLGICAGAAIAILFL